MYALIMLIFPQKNAYVLYACVFWRGEAKLLEF